MVHALGGPAVRQAVEAGARSIEHGVFLTEADAALMAARGCALVPTLVIYDKLDQLARAGQLTGPGRTVPARWGSGWARRWPSRETRVCRSRSAATSPIATITATTWPRSPCCTGPG